MGSQCFLKDVPDVFKIFTNFCVCTIKLTTLKIIWQITDKCFIFTLYEDTLYCIHTFSVVWTLVTCIVICSLLIFSMCSSNWTTAIEFSSVTFTKYMICPHCSSSSSKNFTAYKFLLKNFTTYEFLLNVLEYAADCKAESWMNTRWIFEHFSIGQLQKTVTPTSHHGNIWKYSLSVYYQEYKPHLSSSIVGFNIVFISGFFSPLHKPANILYLLCVCISGANSLIWKYTGQRWNEVDVKMATPSVFIVSDILFLYIYI